MRDGLSHFGQTLRWGLAEDAFQSSPVAARRAFSLHAPGWSLVARTGCASARALGAELRQLALGGSRSHLGSLALSFGSLALSFGSLASEESSPFRGVRQSGAISALVRAAQRRAARRRHQQSPEGRIDHRDRNQKLRRLRRDAEQRRVMDTSSVELAATDKCASPRSRR